MKGSTFKRCGCPPTYDAKGRRRACGKKHGSWGYVVDLGVSPKTGKRQQARKSGFRTQADADRALAEVLSDIDSGRYRHDERQTVAQYLDRWYEQKKQSLRPTTRSRYSRDITVTKSRIGHMRLRDLRPSHLTTMYHELYAEALEANKAATPSPVQKIQVTLRSALADAKREQLIKYNPATDAVVPKARTVFKVSPWSGEDLGSFLDYVGSHKFGSLFELIALTGMRRGEALGLRWCDVDVEAGHLVVRQQLAAVATSQIEAPCTCGVIHKTMAFGPPKTASGEARIIDLTAAGVAVLLTHRLAQDEQRAKVGELWRDHDLVFPDELGDPLRPNHVTKTFNALVADAGLRRIRLHDLRHGRASLMLAAGVDISIVSKVLGHSTVRLAQDTYSHLLEGVGKKAAEAADALIIRQPRDQSVTTSAPELDAEVSR